MFYVYILKSKKDEKLYFGSTSDLRKRLKLHNEGKVYSTKSRRPFELLYYGGIQVRKRCKKKGIKFKITKQGFYST